MTLKSFGTARRFQVFGTALMLGGLLMSVFPHAASAAVTGTATPNSGLGATGTLAVTASGFNTGDLFTVHVIECERGATDSAQCDANTDDSQFNTTTVRDLLEPRLHVLRPAERPTSGSATSRATRRTCATSS